MTRLFCLKKHFLVFSFLFCFTSFCWSRALTYISPVEGIDWTFETTMGFQNLGNMLMSKEAGSSTQTENALFFYGILFHSYYEKLPMLKAQMNMGFKDRTTFYWSDQPDFNHEDQLLNEQLKCLEVDVHYLMPSIIGYRGIFFPYLGYTYLNYSYEESFDSGHNKNTRFHGFSTGLEYSQKINKVYSHNYYFSFTPIMLNNNGQKSFFYYNYGAEIILNSSPVSVTLFMAFRNGFEKASSFLKKDQYEFSNSEIGISIFMNLRPVH